MWPPPGPPERGSPPNRTCCETGHPWLRGCWKANACGTNRTPTASCRRRRFSSPVSCTPSDGAPLETVDRFYFGGGGALGFDSFIRRSFHDRRRFGRKGARSTLGPAERKFGSSPGARRG